MGETFWGLGILVNGQRGGGPEVLAEFFEGEGD